MKSCPCRLFPLLLGCLLVALAAVPASAQDALLETTSLRFVPAEADHYLAAHHLAEVTQSLLESQAMARLDEVLKDELGDDYRAGFTLQSFVDGLDHDDTELIALFNWLGDPANHARIELGQEMLSHEVFYYRVGGEGNRNAEEYWTVDNLIALAKLGFSEDPALRHREILAEVLAAQAQSDTAIAIPQTVAGFRVSDPQQALAQLDWAEAIVRQWVEQKLPVFSDAISQEQVGEGRYVLVRFQGEAVPWEELIAEQLHSDPEQHAQALERLRSLEGVLGVGVLEDYVLVFIVPSTEVLPGQGGELLWNEDRLASLREAELTAEEVFTIRYRSAEGTPPLDREALRQERLEDAQGFLEAFNVDPQVFDAVIRPKLEEFLFDMGFFDLEPGPLLSYTFFTEAGLEGYTRNWGESPYPHDGRTLEILPHVGGDPLVVVARRRWITPRGYNVFAKWAARGGELLKQYYEADLRGDPALRVFKEDWDIAVQHFQAMDQNTRDTVLPALGDGQVAWVLDNGLRASVIDEGLEQNAGDTRLFEPALVLSIEDRDALLAAGEVYQQEINDLVCDFEKIQLGHTNPPRETLPEEFVEIIGDTQIKIVTYLQVESTPQGDIYRPFSVFSSNDSVVLPHFGVGENMLAVAGTPQHAQRLLAEEAWQAPLYVRDRDRAVMAVTHYDMAGIVNTAREWHLAKLENAELAAIGPLGLERRIPLPVLLPIPSPEPPGLRPLQELEGRELQPLGEIEGPRTILVVPSRGGVLPRAVPAGPAAEPGDGAVTLPYEGEVIYPPALAPEQEEAVREELADLDARALEAFSRENQPEAPGVHRLPRSEELGEYGSLDGREAEPAVPEDEPAQQESAPPAQAEEPMPPQATEPQSAPRAYDFNYYEQPEEEAPPVEIELTYPTQPAVPEYTPEQEEAFRELMEEQPSDELQAWLEENQPQLVPQPDPPEDIELEVPDERTQQEREAAARAARIARIHYACDLLECFEGYTSITWHEDEAVVTHYELRYHDLPAEL